jgi:cytochrome c5
MRSTPRAFRPFSALLLLALESRLPAQDGASSSVAVGRDLFQRLCATCHGANATGGRGSDLSSGRWRWGASHAEIVRNILKRNSRYRNAWFPAPAAGRAANCGVNRNGLCCALDRQADAFLPGKAFADVTRADSLDKNGHPIIRPGSDPTPEGTCTYPDAQGASNFAAPSFDPQTNLFFLAVCESCAVYTSRTPTPVPGAGYTGTGARVDEQVGHSAGLMATAGGLIFAAGVDGNLIDLNATGLVSNTSQLHPAPRCSVSGYRWTAKRRLEAFHGKN